MIATHSTLSNTTEQQISFRSGLLWPDDNGMHINAHGGGVLLHEGTYYWFGEHKTVGKAGNYAQVGVHVYSSRDLLNWKDEGIALSVSGDPGSDIARGCILERPKVIYNAGTKQFVMWFHLELAGQGYKAARSGVATADQPLGPYRFIESFRPNAGVWSMDIPEGHRVPLTAAERQKLDTIDQSGGMQASFPGDLVFRRDFSGGQMARDMTLFVDDGGAAFHVYSSEENGTLHISQLTDDYLRPAGRCVRIFPGRWNEAPALFKYQGRYFMFTSGCTGWTPNPARLSTAESIWGPWKEIGNPCIGSDAQKSNTFESQSTFVLPVAGEPGAFIFMGDRWRPNNAIDGRYIWLPIEFQDGAPAIKWHDKWDLSIFNTKS